MAAWAPERRPDGPASALELARSASCAAWASSPSSASSASWVAGKAREGRQHNLSAWVRAALADVQRLQSTLAEEQIDCDGTRDRRALTPVTTRSHCAAVFPAACARGSVSGTGRTLGSRDRLCDDATAATSPTAASLHASERPRRWQRRKWGVPDDAPAFGT